jgi:hypothetical protein
MTRGRAPSIKACASAAALFIATLAAVQTVVAPSAGAAATPTFRVAPSSPIRYERVTLSGKLPSAVRRPVALQRRYSGTWHTIGSAQTMATGAYSKVVAMSWTSAIFRFTAPAATINGRKYTAISTSATTIKTVAQSGKLTAPSWVEVAHAAKLVAAFAPVRAGRAIQFQRYYGGAWHAVGSANENTNGVASVSKTFASNGTLRFRGVATARAGAHAAASAATYLVVGQFQTLDRSVDLVSGSSAAVDLTPTLSRADSLTVTSGNSAAVSMTRGADGSVDVAATDDAQSDTTDFTATGTGCVGATCGIHFKLTVSASVSQPTDVDTGDAGFSQPSPDRLADANLLPSGEHALTDEVILTLGTPTAPGDLSTAESIASDVGAVVTGAMEDIGVYELRWTTPPDMTAVLAQLAGTPGVGSAEPSAFGLIGTQSTTPPGDWSDDGQAVKWPFEQIRAPQAWDTTTGGDARVGIVESDTVYNKHEDLTVDDTLGPGSLSGTHATHVAGLACARANGKGLVGVAWGCPIVSSTFATGKTTAQLDKNVLQAAHGVAAEGVKVVNMSIGVNAHTSTSYCVSKSDSDEILADSAKQAAPFRQLFNGVLGRDIVWTISAGNNCGLGTHSGWGANWDLPNVITVAASNSDGTLASFSNFGVGVEVAAPGGVGIGITGGNDGVWSTWWKKCGILDLATCSDYHQQMGTSMAAPIVAGVAELVASANPSLSGADIGSCITSTAGINTPTITERSTQPTKAGSATVTPHIAFSGSLPVVNAEAAVQCALNGVAHGDVLIAGQGDRTSSGNGTDIGDLSAELTSGGYHVVTSSTLPASLSGFKQVWYFDTEAMTSDEQSEVESYVSGGGHIYLTGEWGCCSVDNSSIALINALVPGASVSHGGSDDDNVTIKSDAPFGLATTPHSVATVQTSSPGSLDGVPDANIVGYASDPSRAVVAAWGSSDVSGGGKIVIVMDINWVAEQYRADNWSDFVENIAHFLS